MISDAESAARYGTTPMPDTDPLTRRQVEALADGTPIIVTWSGGNGPHRYTLRHHLGYIVAKSEHDRDDYFDITGRCLGPDAFVGQQQFHTRVWLLEHDEGAGDGAVVRRDTP